MRKFKVRLIEKAIGFASWCFRCYWSRRKHFIRTTAATLTPNAEFHFSSRRRG